MAASKTQTDTAIPASQVEGVAVPDADVFLACSAGELAAIGRAFANLSAESAHRMVDAVYRADPDPEWRCEACQRRGWAWCGDSDLPQGCAESACDGAEHLCPDCAGTGVAARTGEQTGAQTARPRRDMAS